MPTLGPCSLSLSKNDQSDDGMNRIEPLSIRPLLAYGVDCWRAFWRGKKGVHNAFSARVIDHAPFRRSNAGLQKDSSPRALLNGTKLPRVHALPQPKCQTFQPVFTQQYPDHVLKARGQGTLLRWIGAFFARTDDAGATSDFRRKAESNRRGRKLFDRIGVCASLIDHNKAAKTCVS